MGLNWAGLPLSLRGAHLDGSDALSVAEPGPSICVGRDVRCPESVCRTCTLPHPALAPHELMVVPICSSFFSRWFDTKSVAVKQQVKKFVENGQLEFVEGSPFHAHT